jgi:hypothetical protein
MNKALFVWLYSHMSLSTWGIDQGDHTLDLIHGPIPRNLDMWWEIAKDNLLEHSLPSSFFTQERKYDEKDYDVIDSNIRPRLNIGVGSVVSK